MDYDLTLMDTYPNKYNLTIDSIKQLKVLDWEALKKCTYANEAMTDGTWFCKLILCGGPGVRQCDNDEDDFWIGFREEDNKVDCHFTSFGGMCGYIFDKFYDLNEIENKFDFYVQINTIKWLNEMIDKGVLAI